MQLKHTHATHMAHTCSTCPARWRCRTHWTAACLSKHGYQGSRWTCKRLMPRERLVHVGVVCVFVLVWCVCLCMCVVKWHASEHTHAHKCTHTRTHTHTHTHAHTHTHTHINTHINTHTHTYVQACHQTHHRACALLQYSRQRSTVTQPPRLACLRQCAPSPHTLPNIPWQRYSPACV